MNPKSKLLYLGSAFPPGVAGHFPEAQPAGHLIETNLVNSLRPWFDVRSVGVSWIRVEDVPPGDPSPGLPHALNLLDTKPEAFHRYRSLARLKRQYLLWLQAGWKPNAILVCNFSPVFNAFIRWLKHQPRAPRIILYLADSVNLQRQFSWIKRLRYRFKPLTWPDGDMIRHMDACVAVSRSTEQFFAARKLPWLWLPNGCDPARVLPSTQGLGEGEIQFGYFGALSDYTGLPALLSLFASRTRAGTLHICGFGKAKTEIEAGCRMRRGLCFYGPRTPDECLCFALNCDVLVNPRPLWPGNENNFPSKIFEYALSGRAILTSRVSVADRILGDQAFYFDEYDYDRSLGNALEQLTQVPRAELNRRGASVQERLLTNYSWAQQGERLASFIQLVLAETRANRQIPVAPRSPGSAAQHQPAGRVEGLGAGLPEATGTIPVPRHTPEPPDSE